MEKRDLNNILEQERNIYIRIREAKEEKLGLLEKKFKYMIEKGSTFWIKVLSCICYS